jgi:3-phenylpropionate/trans-cinnamate dioxygenase ferredoxin reductase subunit
MKEKILIIGAGQAGMQIASSLRDEGYAGDVTIVGEEAYAPYQRPPLSKAYLAGDMDEESLEFRNEHFYVENNIGRHRRQDCARRVWSHWGGCQGQLREDL